MDVCDGPDGNVTRVFKQVWGGIGEERGAGGLFCLVDFIR